MSIVSVPGNKYGINLSSQTPDLIASFVVAFAPTNNDGIFEVPVVLPDPALDPTGKLFYSTTLKRLVKVRLQPQPALGLHARSDLQRLVHDIPRLHALGRGESLDLQHIGFPCREGR